MKAQICNAIHNLKIIEFYYENYYRKVEPHSLGVSTGGKDMLSGYQVGGQSDSKVPGWKNFDLNKITGFSETNIGFNGPEFGYKRNSDRMTSIECEL